jgi:hypothetical protein
MKMNPPRWKTGTIVRAPQPAGGPMDGGLRGSVPRENLAPDANGMSQEGGSEESP